MKMFT